MVTKPLLGGISLAAFMAFAVHAQTGFDVASIKPSDPLARGSSIGTTPAGDFNANGVTVKTLIEQAWDMRPFQVSGGPGWLTTDRFDILTKSENGNLTEDQLRTMTEDQRNDYWNKLLAKVQILLADRFQLKIHKETRELPIYGLVIAKSGSKLQMSKDDGNSGGSLGMHRDDTGKSVITASKLPLSSLVRLLGGQVGRKVVDQTGLTAVYDFKMTYTADMAQRPAEAGLAEPAVGAGDGPSLFTALQEQLGLKLDSQKAPVEVVVIDSIQKASEN